LYRRHPAFALLPLDGLEGPQYLGLKCRAHAISSTSKPEDLEGHGPQDHVPETDPVVPAASNPRLKRQRPFRGLEGYYLPHKFARCIRPILSSSRAQTPEIREARGSPSDLRFSLSDPGLRPSPAPRSPPPAPGPRPCAAAPPE
jgi:hypothetical protein